MAHMSNDANAVAGIGRLNAVFVDEVESTTVVNGISRRGLPGGAVGARVYDIAAGVEWPEVDHHSIDESIYVVDGELIEGEHHYPAGSFLHYQPGTSHQPRTETGVRILVFGLAG